MAAARTSLRRMAAVALASWVIVASSAAAEDATEPLGEPSPPATIELRDYLVVPAVGQYGRLPIHQDAIEDLLVTHQWQSPVAGQLVRVPDGGSKAWRAAVAEEGTLDARGLRGGYAFAEFESDDERVMLLEAAGHAAVYVNGELRAGDPYRLGWLRLPVPVRQGKNWLLFHLAAEELSARLTAPPAGVFFMAEDRTLPTLVRGEREVLWGAVPVVNATGERLVGLEIECQRAGNRPLSTSVPPIGPLTVFKVPFQIPAEVDGGDHVHLTIRLSVGSESAAPLAETEIKLNVTEPDDVQVRTFRSRIDGSVQPYAVRPAVGGAAASQDDSSPGVAGGAGLPGLIVTLHDAGVDCAAHVAQYAAKDWAHVVAPQGRRPHGFDWEDWGRIDVLEAMADARRRYPSDPRRTYLTGLGMGGHGAWHLGVTYPDQFAAIGPVGGWASFWSYGGGMPTFANPNRLEAQIAGSYLPSDVVQLLSNLADVGVYVLHGEADDVVPVEQARFMRSRLAAYHGNFVYHERHGATHAWGGDWPAMMEFFRRNTQPTSAERTNVDFTTADPGVSSRCDWVSIEAQQEPLRLSRVSIRRNDETRTVVGQTINVARLAIHVSQLPPGQAIDVTLDGQQLASLSPPGDGAPLRFERAQTEWRQLVGPASHGKSPERSGSFKSAFDHDVLLVYGTGGTEQEDRWAEAKARYDTESYWYRGGGSLEVLADTDFNLESAADRNVVLYGNADTNAVWSKLLANCPVQVRRGQLRIGDEPASGDDLAALFVFPRSDSDRASVAVVAGTGPVGMALTNRYRYFVSGIAYPECLIVRAPHEKSRKTEIRTWRNFDSD